MSLVLLGSAAVLVGSAVVRHARGAMGRRVPGGILMSNAARYDRWSHRLLLGSLFRRIAADIAAAAPDHARVLEVGSGPGRLAIMLVREHDLDVSGVDLDPAMIELATTNARVSGIREERRPSFRVGDVSSLAFHDGSFDVVVSTLSMHHWTDPAAGLVEIGRVLRAGGRALIWDLRPGIVQFHRHGPDPLERARGSMFGSVGEATWRWPWCVGVLRRIELVRGDGEPGVVGGRIHRVDGSVWGR
jgi:SAM-dependent methyltransferase